MKYIDQVVDNYGANFEKASGEIDTSVNDLYTVIDSILKENTFPEEQMTKWTTLLATASTKAAELKLKIEDKYKQMTNKATYFDEIVSTINTKAEEQTRTNAFYTNNQLGMTEIWWVLDSGAAAMEIDEGYPWAFYHEDTIKKTRENTDTWTWTNGTKTTDYGSRIIKTKEEIMDLPVFNDRG